MNLSVDYSRRINWPDFTALPEHEVNILIWSILAIYHLTSTARCLRQKVHLKVLYTSLPSYKAAALQSVIVEFSKVENLFKCTKIV